MQSFTALCANLHKILCKKIATVTSSPKIDIYLKAFSTKLSACEMFGSWEFGTVFRVAPKSICRLVSQATNAKNAGVSGMFPNLTALDGWNMI